MKRRNLKSVLLMILGLVIALALPPPTSAQRGTRQAFSLRGGESKEVRVPISEPCELTAKVTWTGFATQLELAVVDEDGDVLATKELSRRRGTRSGQGSVATTVADDQADAVTVRIKNKSGTRALGRLTVSTTALQPDEPDVVPDVPDITVLPDRPEVDVNLKGVQVFRFDAIKKGFEPAVVRPETTSLGRIAALQVFRGAGVDVSDSSEVTAFELDVRSPYKYMTGWLDFRSPAAVLPGSGGAWFDDDGTVDVHVNVVADKTYLVDVFLNSQSSSQEFRAYFTGKTEWNLRQTFATRGSHHMVFVLQPTSDGWVQCKLSSPDSWHFFSCNVMTLE